MEEAPLQCSLDRIPVPPAPALILHPVSHHVPLTPHAILSVSSRGAPKEVLSTYPSIGFLEF